MSPRSLRRAFPTGERHSWNLSGREARRLQERLAGRVIRKNSAGRIRTLAGVDCSYKNGRGRAAACLFAYPALELLEEATAEGPAPFPYVPGLLSFREAPLVIRALAKLTRSPDCLMVDGHGLAHPRRLGIASHLGVVLDIPAVGCAKSRLCGRHTEPGKRRGDWVPLCDRGERVGAVLRTKANVRPLFVSTGHRVALPRAVNLVLGCCRGYRLPETTRTADSLAAL